MAIVLMFKQGDSGTQLNLMDGEDGFQLAGNGWNPSVATPVHMGDPAPIIETIHLLLKRGTQDSIANYMQNLHEMQVLADRYINDPTQEEPVWLWAQMASETGSRRALVHRLSIQFKTSWFGESATALDIPLVITLVRGPYWERATARNLPQLEPSAAACVVYNYTAAGSVVGAHDIVGDMGARVRYWHMYFDTALKHAWMGIRSAGKHGATGISNFEHIWELEDGFNFTDAADAVDATASGGDRVQVVESGVDWDDGDFHPVCYLMLSDVTANPEDNLGNFLWMLRAKASAGSTTWEVKLRFTYYDSESEHTADYVDTDIKSFTSSSWMFYEMGIMTIGLRNIHSLINSDYSFANEGNFRVDIYARRTAGAANLYVDCLCPIPIDEGFCKIDAGGVGVALFRTVFGVAPEGVVDSVIYSHTSDLMVNSTSIVNLNNFVLPPGDGRIYIIPTWTNQDITAQLHISMGDVGRYYERWLSLRGSE